MRAESVTPETARQAVQAWTEESAGWQRYAEVSSGRPGGLLGAGDALALLVPQLLDQLAEADRRERETEQELADALDELRKSKQTTREMVRVIGEVKKERDDNFVTIDTLEADYAELGERCRQLETALRTIATHSEEVGTDHFYYDCKTIMEQTARAGLGGATVVERG